MRILLLNQFFWPDSAATSQLLTDVARGLSGQGHEVHAIAGNSGYACPESDSDCRPDVHIHRAPAIRFARGRFGRPASYLSFLLTAAIAGLFIPKPDIVVSLTTPPLLSLIGMLLKILRGSRHYIWEMDVYPDIAIDLRVIRPKSLVARVTGFLADRARCHADGVIALGECMRKRLLTHGIPASQISVADNWADGEEIVPTYRPLMSNNHHDRERPLVFLYSGNFGLAHDLDTIYGAMLHFRDDPRFQFIFAGDGTRRTVLEKRSRLEGLTNIHFRPYSSRQNLGRSLCDGDIGLVTQIPDTLGSLVPSKVYGLMAAGRPILFVGPEASTPAQIIRRFNCGWHIPCGDERKLCELLVRLKDNPTVVKDAGRRARTAFEANFDLLHGVGRICSIIGAPIRAADNQVELAATPSENPLEIAS